MDISKRVDRLADKILPATAKHWKVLLEAKENIIDAEYDAIDDQSYFRDYFQLIRKHFQHDDAERIINGLLFEIFCEPEDE